MEIACHSVPEVPESKRVFSNQTLRASMYCRALTLSTAVRMKLYPSQNSVLYVPSVVGSTRSCRLVTFSD